MKNLMTGAATALLLAAPAAAQDASTVLATVNGTEITLGHVIAMRERLPAQYQQLPDEALLEGMVEQLIQQQVLADAAREDLSRANELGLENEARAFLAGRVIDEAAAGEVTEAELQAAYEAEYGDAEPSTEYNASHILVETQAEAQAIMSQLQDGADFAELAREESTGPSGPNGGELGWFGTGMMVPEFENAVTALEPGELGGPVQTQFGWHVIKLNETRQQAAPELAQVADALRQQIVTDRVDATVESLVEDAEIERIETELDPSLIRQTDLLD